MSSLCGDDSVNTLIEEIGMDRMTKAGIITKFTHKQTLDEGVDFTSHKISEKPNRQFICSLHEIAEVGGSPGLPLQDRWRRKSHASTTRQHHRHEGCAAPHAGVLGDLG